MSLAEDLAEVWNEAEARRGRRWAYPELDAASTALIVVGATRGLIQNVSQPQFAFARLTTLAETLRRAGGRVVWTRPDDRPAPRGLALAQGAGRSTARQDEFAEEAPRPAGDLVLRIRPPSVFYPGASFAPHLLREAGVTTLIFAGGLTHLEVESSVRDAVCAGFQCVVAADCCLDLSAEAHLGALKALHRSFADVRPAADLVTLLRRNFGMSAIDVDDAMEAASRAVAASAAALPLAPQAGKPAPQPPAQPLAPPLALPPAPAAALAPPAFAAAAPAAAPPASRAPLASRAPAPLAYPRSAAPAEPEPEPPADPFDFDEAGEGPSMEEILEAIRRSESFARAAQESRQAADSVDASPARGFQEVGPPPSGPQKAGIHARPAAPRGGGAFRSPGGKVDEPALRAYIPSRPSLASEPDPSKP